MSKICVLLSSYNGEKYIKDQIESILSQSKVELSLVVRDDGSTDKTVDILNEFQKNGKLTYYQGSNLGPARSFMQLLKDAPDADYYAFSDQDDYWLPDKLETAINMLEVCETNKPALYFSQTQLVDRSLNQIPSVIINPLLTFGESLIYEFIGGCTMVLNKVLKQIVNSYTPNFLIMHDTWIYTIALAVGGEVYFDPKPHMYYRQHENNVVGQGTSIWTSIRRRYKRIVKMEQSRYYRAVELNNGFSNLIPPKNKEILDLFLKAKTHFPAKLKLITDYRFNCSKNKIKRAFNIAVLLNVY